MNLILSECIARARARSSSRFFIAAIWLTCCLMLAGCSTPKASTPQASADTDERYDFWKPYDLYLLSSPHPRLYVEVDAVKGCAPSDNTLQKLRDFLTTYCHKPEGIEIVRSDVISIESARQILPGALARKFINGPPDNSTSAPPAFMYVLFYNDDLIDKRVVVETGRHPEPNPLPHSRKRTRNPHITRLPYPAAIYMNTRYWSHYKSFRNIAPLHEAGHLLGLAGRSQEATNYHCLNKNCFMNEVIAFNIVRPLLGRDPITQGQLCERCVAELTENAKPSPPSNLRFVGPVLVRSEEGYHVLSLPNRVKLIVGNLTEQDCRDFAASVRAETPSPQENDGDARAFALAKEEVASEPTKARDIINRAKADPLELVRIIASKLEKAAE